MVLVIQNLSDMVGCMSVSASFFLSLFSSVQFGCLVVSTSLRPHGLRHARPPCPSPTPGVYPNSCPLSQWCHPTISSSVVPFSFRLQSFPSSASPSFSADFICHNPIKKFCLSFFSISIQSWMPIEYLYLKELLSPTVWGTLLITIIP